MQKQEFEKRIGLVITSEEYAGIEAAYMGLPETVDKDKFVKIWLREGGIQDLFDKRMAEVKRRDEEIGWLKKEIEELEGRINRDATDYVKLHGRTAYLEGLLEEISETLTKRTS
jgi:hypothetical protein